jgi:transcriptional regulator with XRE-family HTH domain
MMPGMPITPAQSRAGRGLVSMTQQGLADASGVSLRTITSFEKCERTPMPANLAALKAALEAAGVIFTNGDEPGVKLRARAQE